jgi:arginine/ornithine N-succinyltransferase beta subunit
LERGPVADRLIERVLSPGDYLRVLDYYDELSGDDDDETQLVAIWFLRAACKESRWKSKMLRWFMHVVGLGQPLNEAGIAEMASLADAMGARVEWQALCAALFGMDPYAAE